MNPVLKLSYFGAITLGAALLAGCGSDGALSLFSVENDKELGAQVAAEIEAADTTYTILSADDYPEAYAYLEGVKQDILNSGEVEHAADFDWELYILEDDETLNAFATPGGYIYVYTGLIKYLDRVDDLAGVLGHEIAHADRRHSVKALIRSYGAQTLLSIALGDNASQLSEIAATIASTGATLAFSRDAEAEADEYSVIYLAETDYACNGAYSFFQKLIEEDATGNTPTFLSTHPDPEDRVEDINKKADNLGCDTGAIVESGFDYEDFKNSLP